MIFTIFYNAINTIFGTQISNNKNAAISNTLLTILPQNLLFIL
jgi:hypothetical protein